MKSKKITIITANYYPEDTAIGLYTSQFAEYLKNNSFNVTVLTGFPYYPNWKIPENYENKPSFYKEINNGVEVIRYKQYVPSKVNFKSRILMILSFNFGLLVNLFKLKKSDLVICIVPFTTNCFIGKLYSLIYKTKFWIHLQDFEFDLLIDSGIGSKKSFFTKLFFKFLLKTESIILNSADLVSTISNSMMGKVYEKSNPKNTFFFPNWVSINNINPETSKKHNYFNPLKYNLLYSGNIGEKQDWNFFIEFCKLINKDDNIEIVIVGNGGYSDKLKERAGIYDFIKFKDVVPYSELSDLLCSADIHFLFQKYDVVDSVMPSKLLGMMASTRPSIVTGSSESEVNTILTNSKGGFYCSSNKPVDVYQKIIELKNNAEKTFVMGQNARKYVEEHFDSESVLSSFLSKVNQITHEK
ncbi:WcaI family glycosyltransferase [Flavobacterium sp. N2270]|uniref:WcaI family glycosyltransferase n=1 Tax=Flavobacterium sp. N2270 TaxID=2986831 RepID=UPI002225AF1E|nr:WcaI family glycosyltransferase [Flavobacterium sp. N2270]